MRGTFVLCSHLPRVALASLPTPLEEAPRLAAALGGPRLLFKRDDLSGLCWGGNKVRVMDYVMGDVIEQGCDVVISSAGVQSNKLREIAAAANRLGLRAVLLLQGDPPQGNLLLFHLLGAEVRYLSAEERSGPGVLAAQEQLRAELEGEGRSVAVLDRRLAYGAVATAAYVDAAEELVLQLARRGLDPDVIYVSVGAGMTMAGLVLGIKHLSCRARVVGVCMEPQAAAGPQIVDFARRAAELLGLSTRVARDDFDLVDEYLGAGYAALVAPIELVARHHGLVLDPVYNARTMLALVDRVRAGGLTAAQTVVYLNTGGSPALFGAADELSHPERS